VTGTSLRGRRSWPVGVVLLVITVMTVLVAGPAGAAPGGRPQPAASPVPVVIGTIPPVPGYPVILDGVTVPTDEEGNASFRAVNDGRPLSERVTLTDAELTLDGRPVRASGSSVSEVWSRPMIRLDISYQVAFHFAAVDGSPVRVSAIEGITLKSTNGEVVDLKVGETPWLHGTRVVQVLGQTQVRQIDWSVQHVGYAGSNVVNAAQQVFRPADKKDVDVALLFFGVDLQVSDAFFGFPQSGAVKLRFPDGTARRYPLDGDGRLSLPELPRGDYTLTSIGSGPDLSRPLAISRDQEVDLAFYSWLDILLALGVCLLLAAGLAGWGRARRGRRRGAHARARARARARATDPDKAVIAIPVEPLPATFPAARTDPDPDSFDDREPAPAEPAGVTTGGPG
jgi:hypothetical protein